MDIIKSQDNFSIIKEDTFFYVLYKNKYIHTLKGSIVKTKYYDIAEAIFEEYNLKIADACLDPTTTTYFYYSYIDFFIEKKQNEASIGMINKRWENEWTLKQCKSKNISHIQKWKSLFGEPNERKNQIVNWLNKCTCMQLSAVNCVYNYYYSMNIPFIMSRVIDKNKIKEEAFLKIITSFINECDPTFNIDQFNKIFVQFKFYYSIEKNN